MNQRVVLYVLLLSVSFLWFTGTIQADGKFYVGEDIPPEIPYQRALLIFDKGQETLLIQSKFQQSPGSKQTLATGSMGWVIPVPNEPEIASIHKYLEHCEPQGFIDPNDYKGPGFLCKFRDILTAEQMQDDLVFTVSDNQKPYRERVYMWW